MRAWGQPGLLGGSGTALEKDTGTGVTRSHPAAPAFFVCPSRRQKIKRVADLEADFKDTPSCSSPETHIIVCTPPWASTQSQLLPERRTPKGPKQKQPHSVHGRAFCKGVSHRGDDTKRPGGKIPGHATLGYRRGRFPG